MKQYKNIKSIIFTQLISLLLSYGVYAQHQWNENGIKVADATASSIGLNAVSDDSGYVYFTYQDTSVNEDYLDIFAQKIDLTGTKKWTDTGIIVINASENQVNPSIAIDGIGGIYIAWHDNLDNKIYIQHINKEGQLQWDQNGKTVCSENSSQLKVKLISDNSGGIYVIWKDKRNDEGDIYAQYFDINGDRQWPATGVAVTTASGDQSDYQPICTNNGDLIIVWVDQRSGDWNNKDIYVQKISAEGTAQWVPDGIEIVTQDSTQYLPAIEQCGSKYIITWTDKRNDKGDIYAQLIDENGDIHTQWDTDGIPICKADNTQNRSRITESCSSSVIITWMDSRSGGYDIYAQRIDSLGTELWTSIVNNNSSFQYFPKITADGSGGAFIAWLDLYNKVFNINSQHIDKNGQLLWDSNGLTIASTLDNQDNQIVVSDRSGGFITLWRDQRNNQNDIYAQLTNDNIAITSPSSGDILNGTADHTISWSMNTNDVIVDHLSLKASAEGMDYTIIDNISPTQLSQTWSSPNINSTDVTIYIQALDKNNSVLCTYQSDPFTIDSEPPLAFNLLTPADNDTVEKIITFEWEPTTDNFTGLSHYELWIDRSLFLDDLQNTTYTLSQTEALSIGPHTWTVRAVDSAGVYYDPAEYSIEVVYDNTPPEAFHLLNPEHNTWTTVNNPIFRWESSSDPGRSLKNYKLYLDGSFIADISPDRTTFSEPIVTPGDHTWYVTAVDSADNVTKSTETWTIRMDNEPPFPFSLLQPESHTWINDTTPEFSWEQTSDTSTGIGLAEYELWIDHTRIIDDISGDNQVVQIPTSKALTEGTHTWYIKAKDSLENSRNSRAEFTVNIDTTRPSSFNLTAPEHESYIKTLNPNFSWTASEDNLSGLRKYRLYIDQSLNKDNISTLQTQVADPLTEGQHTWSVTAWDSAGNVRNINTFTFTIDTTSPEPFQLISPEDNETVYISTPRLSWQAAQDDLAGIKKYTLLLDGAIAVDSIAATETAYTVSQELENSSHTWQITAHDRAGNKRSTDIFQFEVLSNPPEITSASQVEAVEDIFFSYTAQAEDPDQQEVTISFSDYPSWLSPSQNEISGTPREGVQDTTFLVIAFDGFYYDSLRVEVTVIPVNDPPVITSPTTATATEKEVFSYTATAQDVDSDTITITFADYPSWLSVSGTVIQGTPGNNCQDTCFTVIAFDGELYDSLKVTLSVIPVNDPPVITSPDTATATEKELFSYTATAQDVDSDTITITFADYPSWLSVSGTVIQGTPGNNCQDTCFTVIAFDGELYDSLKVTLSVIPVNDPPVITSPTTATATEKELFSYTATAQDVDSDTITITFADYPSWLSVSGTIIQGTPGNNCQDTCFTVIAFDGELYDSLKVTLSVIPVNDPPVFIKPLPRNIIISSQDTLIHNLGEFVNDPDDPLSSLSWHHTVLDTNTLTITLNQKTHIVKINGRKTNGKISIIFKVTDPQDSSAQDTLRFSIDKNTSVNDYISSGIPDNYILQDNFPNPFNNSTTIKYGLPRSSTVTLSIYNMLGQKVDELCNQQKQPAGFHQIDWHSGSLPSGIYFYHLKAGSWTAIKKMILMK